MTESVKNPSNTRLKTKRLKKPKISLKAFLSDEDAVELPSPDQTAWWKKIYKKPAAGHLGVHEASSMNRPSSSAKSASSYFALRSTGDSSCCTSSAKPCSSRPNNTPLGHFVAKELTSPNISPALVNHLIQSKQNDDRIESEIKCLPARKRKASRELIQPLLVTNNQVREDAHTHKERTLTY